MPHLSGATASARPASTHVPGQGGRKRPLRSHRRNLPTLWGELFPPSMRSSPSFLAHGHPGTNVLSCSWGGGCHVSMRVGFLKSILGVSVSPETARRLCEDVGKRVEERHMLEAKAPGKEEAPGHERRWSHGSFDGGRRGRRSHVGHWGSSGWLCSSGADPRRSALVFLTPEQCGFLSRSG